MQLYWSPLKTQKHLITIIYIKKEKQQSPTYEKLQSTNTCHFSLPWLAKLLQINFLSIDKLSLKNYIITNYKLHYCIIIKVSSPHEEILVWSRWSFLQHQACQHRYWDTWKENISIFWTQNWIQKLLHVCCARILLLNAHNESSCDLLQVPHGISITCYLFICFHYFLYLEKEDIHN